MEDEILHLHRFGLTSLQAKVYVSLLKLGPCHASQIGSQVAIVRPEVYRVLRELSTIGLVQISLGFPATYSPLPPRQGLSLLVQRLKDNVSTLEKERKELTEWLEAGEFKSLEESREAITLIKGERNLLQKTSQMIETAREEYIGIWSQLGLRDFAESRIGRKLTAAKNRRVRIRVIADVDSHSIKVANYLTRIAEVRRSRNLLFYMDIIDQKEMVFGPSFPIPGESQMESRELNIFTNHLRFVSGMYAIFEKIWQISPTYLPTGIFKKHLHPI